METFFDPELVPLPLKFSIFSTPSWRVIDDNVPVQTDFVAPNFKFWYGKIVV
jgi:hypothetical protein